MERGRAMRNADVPVRASQEPALYVASARRADAVASAVAARLTSADDRNVVVNKSTHLEVFRVTISGTERRFELVADIPVNGRVATVTAYTPQGAVRDSLLVTTEACEYLVLAFDDASSTFATLRFADVADRLARPCDVGQWAAVDSASHYALLYFYQGLLRVVNISQIKRHSTRKAAAESQVSSNLRITELNLIAITFLDSAPGMSQSIAAILYMDSEGAVHLRSGIVSLNDSELRPHSVSMQYLDPTASMLIPANYNSLGGGVVIVGQNSIIHVDAKNTIAIASINTTVFTCHCSLDANGNRYLLGDDEGRIFVLVLYRQPATEQQQNPKTEIRLEFLGLCSIATALLYLGDGYVYVGSRMGDSQIIQLSVQPNPLTNSHLTVTSTFENLGPILDFVLTDLENNGQQQMVACCGADRDGSLRTIKNGIGFNVIGELDDLPDSKGLWSVKHTPGGNVLSYMLVLSFRDCTKLLINSESDDGSLEPVESRVDTIRDIVFTEPTLYCGNMSNNNIVQITASGIYLLSEIDLTLVHHWSSSKYPSSSTSKITLAVATVRQVVVLLNTNTLIYFEIDIPTNSLKQVQEKHFTEEISCIDMSPLKEDSLEYSDYIAVGEWLTGKISIYGLPDFGLVEYQTIHMRSEVNDIVRSVKMAQIASKSYLFIGLDSGKMIYYNISFPRSLRDRDGQELDAMRISNRRVAVIGRQPVSFSDYRTPEDETLLFAFSDSSTVVYGAKDKLLFSNLNASDAKFITPSVIGGTNVFVMMTSGTANEGNNRTATSLKIGTIATIEKLHITKYPLDNEHARRIAYVDSERVYVVGTVRGVWAGQAYPSSLASASAAIETVFDADRVNARTPYPPTVRDREFIENQENPIAIRMRHEISHIRIFDSFSMSLMDSFELQKGEMVYSITTLDLNVVKNPIPFSNQTDNALFSKQNDLVEANDDPVTSKDTDGVGMAKNETESQQLICVGTTFVQADEVEPRSGRILTFIVTREDSDDSNEMDTTNKSSGKRVLKLIASTSVPGSVYCLDVIDGKLLAGINGNLCLFDFVPEYTKTNVTNSTSSSAVKLPTSRLVSGEMKLLCRYHDPILICSMDVRGNKVTIGDLMKSIYVVQLTKRRLTPNDHRNNTVSGTQGDTAQVPMETTSNQTQPETSSIDDKSQCKYEFVFIARDFSTQWMTAVGTISDTVFLGAENYCNMFMTAINPSPETEFDKRSLVPAGCFHVGQMINKMRRGTLPSGVRENIHRLAEPQYVYATVNGGVGTVSSLNNDLYRLLDALQSVLMELHVASRNLGHTSWLVQNDKTSKMASYIASGSQRLASVFAVGCDYVKYRGYKTECMEIPSTNFIDGDLVELFLNLPQTDQQFVTELVNETLRRRAQSHQRAYEHDKQDEKRNSNGEDHALEANGRATEALSPAAMGADETDSAGMKEQAAIYNIQAYVAGVRTLVPSVLSGILEDLYRLH